MKVFVRGLNACLQRKADVARYRRFIRSNGHTIVADPKESDIILLWTCAYRQDLHDHSLRVIDEYKALGPRLVVCGCIASIDGKALRDHFDGHAFEWKNQESNMIELFGDRSGPLEGFDRAIIETCIPAELETFRASHPEYKVTYSDQFLKMFPSEGCEKLCSYCAERLAFPRYRSVSLEKLVSECGTLMQKTQQYRIVLWADSLGDYGHDIGLTMKDLADSLLAIDDRVQIGLENINPQHCLGNLDYIVTLITTHRLFLLKAPIQSAVDRILALMRRDYTRSDIEKVFSAVSGTGFDNFESDIIAGFPTETNAEFRETITFAVRYRLKYVLLSGYLETPGMDSSRLTPKVESNEIQQRLEFAQANLQAAGIRCNFDNNQASKERFARDFVDFERETAMETPILKSTEEANA